MTRKTPPSRLEPCAYTGCRHGGTWRIFTPDDRFHACGIHLAFVIVQSGARHAAVEPVTTPGHTLAVI